MRKLRFELLLCLISLYLPAHAGEISEEVSKSLYSALASESRLDWLYSAFRGDPFMQQWLFESPLTVVAPTDRAFRKALEQRRVLCEERVPCLSLSDFLNSSALHATILRHVFPGNISIGNVVSHRRMESLSGIRVKVEYVHNWDLRIGGARVVEVNPEIRFQFGTIILVDDVLMDYSKMNVSYIRIAEYIADIGPFDNHERHSLAEAVMDNVECFRKIRSVKLSEDAPLPFAFQLTQDSVDKAQHPGSCNAQQMRKFNAPNDNPNRKYKNRFFDSNILWQIPNDVKRPKRDADLAFMSILELASLLRQDLITSIELTKLYLNRLRSSDIYLEAVITYTEDLALQEAQLADEEMRMGIYRSPLHGIPYGLKDLIAIPGYPTTWGAKVFQNRTFAQASWVYKKLSDSGAVHVAKLATGAMAWGDVWFGGRTKNPWNIQESSRGSSSGSGAATVAGLIPFSIGTETWGSISCPASTMGNTAIRPTFGSIGRSGAMPLAWSLDKIGAFCRTALDCAMILDSLRGQDPKDSSSIHAPLIDPQSIPTADLVIGYTVNSDSRVVREFKTLGFKMKLMELDLDYPIEEIINVLLGAEASTNLDEWIRTNQTAFLLHDEKWLAFVEGARLIPAAEYLLANKVRTELIGLGRRLLNQVDAVLVPAKANGNQGAFGNLIGIPEVVFPTGFENISGSEFSPRKIPQTQALIGAPFSDGRLLGIVAKYQNATDYHLQTPPVENVELHVVENCLPLSQCSHKSRNQALRDG